MAINQKRNWLIAYDIADPKRLGRLHRAIIKHSLPVQYSLYLYNGDNKDIKKLLDELSKHINIREDDLRAYPIPTQTEIHTLGKNGMLDRILLTDENYDQTVRIIKYN